MADVSVINKDAKEIEYELHDLMYKFHQKYPGILLSISANTELIEIATVSGIPYKAHNTKYERSLIILP